MNVIKQIRCKCLLFGPESHQNKNFENCNIFKKVNSNYLENSRRFDYPAVYQVRKIR